MNLSKLQKNLQFLFLVVLFLVQDQNTFSQNRLFTNQQHFSVDDGLPQSYITGIVQDDDGFLWFSTFDGFSRYDGRGFKTFRYNPKDSFGLATNSLNGLGKVADNSVTIYYSATQTDEFNLRTFKTSPNHVRSLLAAMPGILWQSYRFGFNTPNWYFVVEENKGIGWINANNEKVHYANKANGKLFTDTVSAIVESADGRIFLVSEGGVQVSDTAKSKFEWHPFNTGLKQKFTRLSNDVFGEKFSILSFPDKKIAMLEKNKLTILDIPRKLRSTITLPDTLPNSIAGNNGLQLDSKGCVYFEYYGQIYRLNDLGELKLLWEINGAPSRISSFFIDRSDVLWVSLNAQGLIKIDLRAENFQTYHYERNFISDMLRLTGKNKGPLPWGWDKADADYYFRQAWGTKGTLYSSNNWYDRSAVFYLSETGFKKFTHTPENSLFSAVVSLESGEIWAFDQNRSAWYTWKNPDDVPVQLQPDPDNLVNIEVADAKYIGGYIWMTTNTYGLYQFKNGKLVKKYVGLHGKNTVPTTLTEICVDPVNKDRFWIGSRGGGLLLWDVNKGLQRIYTTDDGLPNNTIYCILPDKKGRIWCSTNKGLFRLDPKFGHIMTFEKTDGLQGNEFNRAHKFVLPDGRLVFGGLNGYSVFDPAIFDTIPATGKVPVMLTGLQINNEQQGVNIPGSIVKEPLSILSYLELPHNKNYLRFEFAALLFNQPQKTKYRYQLAGADKQWIENNFSNVAAYSSLPPGKYKFLINATDINGLWSDVIREIRIVILPPFWATWWAWAIYILAFIGLIRLYFIFREKQLQVKQNLAFEKREAIRLREVDELKDRFFSNITHEFRTPLTLIITPLEKLAKDHTLSSAALSTVKTAQRNSKQLLRLINEFLDFSKLNDGQLKLDLTTGEPDLYTSDCVDSFKEAAEEKQISLRFTSEGVKGNYLFDADKWGKIINNLLSNAMKFTPSEGTVEVSLSSLEEELIELSVTDNGPGIPLHIQQKIFDRFYQADDSAIRVVGGTGIGLSLVKELCELMQGGIRLVSQPGIQTSFIVTVPMRKSHKEQFILESDQQAGEQLHKNTADLPLLLVVEDNYELRSYLAESFRENYRVLESSDGLLAWDIILTELPDLVVSDVMMPGQDGFDLCKLCKSDNRTAHIGFILLTSKAAHEARLKGLGTGADDYITKPFNFEELKLRTANLFQYQQKQRAWLQAQFIQKSPEDPLPEITDPFLEKIYEEIDAKIDDAILGVEYLCKVMAMSRSTLNRKLKALLDISPNELIRQYRLQKAAGLISSGMDISSAAYQTGFSSPSYFSQCFKEKYGLTPSDWVSKVN